MRATYDPVADAAYVYLVDVIAPGGVARTLPAMVDLDLAFISFDFGADQNLLGLEILGASRVLASDAWREETLAVRVDYDRAADVAHVYFVGKRRSSAVERTVQADPIELDSLINLHFGAGSQLLGFEIRDAHKMLPPEVLRGHS